MKKGINTIKTVTLFISLLTLLWACESEPSKSIAVKIRNKNIHSYGFEKECYYSDDNNEYDQKSKNIIQYSITNNSDVTYYFNQNPYCNIGSKEYIPNQIDGSHLAITDNEGRLPKYINSESFYTRDYEAYLSIRREKEIKTIQDLGYEERIDAYFFLNKYGFFIHPHETLYFEIVVRLPKEGSTNVYFEKGKSYHAKLEIYSDSTGYKKNIPRPVLKTIEDNGYSIFHGAIESNSIPVIIDKCE